MQPSGHSLFLVLDMI